MVSSSFILYSYPGSLCNRMRILWDLLPWFSCVCCGKLCRYQIFDYLETESIFFSYYQFIARHFFKKLWDLVYSISYVLSGLSTRVFTMLIIMISYSLMPDISMKFLYQILCHFLFFILEGDNTYALLHLCRLYI